MAFPSSPTNGQRITQNGVIYVYSTSTQSWRRDFNNSVSTFFIGTSTLSTSTITGGLVVVGGIGVGGNITVGRGIVVNESLRVLTTTTLSPNGYNVNIAPTNTGTVLINPATTGTIDRMNIGLTSPAQGKFTTATVASLTSTGIVNVGSDLYVSGTIYLRGITVKNYQWMIKDVNYSAQPGDSIFVDTRITATSITITLPASPAFGDTVEFNDYAGNFHIKPLVVNNNGKRIMGLMEPLNVNSKDAANRLIFSGDDFGWRLGVVF